MPHNSPIYDVIVVGAGIEGSSTAYHLAREGQKTLLLEQFPLPHARGSSHGATRMIRKAYPNPLYAEMMKEAYQTWDDVARQSQMTLFKNTGLLLIGRNEDSVLNQTEEALMRIRANFRLLDAESLRREYPMLTFTDGHRALYDVEAGLLFADKSLRAFQDLFKKYGGTLHDTEQVTAILPADIVSVTTTKSSYKCRKIVLTVGPWASQLLKPLGLKLPLKVIRVTVCYWSEKDKGIYGSRTNFPNMSLANKQDVDFYMCSSYEYPGLVKLCYHHGPEIDPDHRDLHKAADDEIIAKISSVIKCHLPYLEEKPSVVENCIYTMTPDADFVIDVHPIWKNVVIGAGFSGHGFKLAPVVGKLLSELAIGRSPSYNLHMFRITRFEKCKL